MLNNMKLGMKIAGTIVLILVIIGASIALTFKNLSSIGSGTNELAKHNMKAIEIASTIERSVHDIRYNMAIYGVTGDATKYDAAAAQFKKSMAYLDEQRIVAQNDAYLKQAIPNINKSDELLMQYNDTAVQTKNTYEGILKSKNALITIGGTMVTDLGKYIKLQNTALTQVYAAGADAAKFNDQVNRLEAINSVNSNVLLIRLYTAKALEARDPAMFDTALKYFDANEQILKGLIAKGGNTDQLNGLLQSSNVYKQGTSEMKEGYVKLADLAKQRLTVSDNLVRVASEIASTSINDAAGTTSATNGTVQATIYTLLLSFLAAVVIGGAVSVYVIKKISVSIKEITEVSKRISQGDVDVNVQVHSKDEIGELAEAFAVMIESIKKQAEVARQIADGERDISVEVRSEKDVLNLKLNEAVGNIRALLDETESITNAVKQGDLTRRGETGELKGVWSDLIKGINELVEAFVKPINVSNEYVTKIGKGVIPDKIEDVYYGDFNNMKESINRCIDSINMLVSDTNTLIDAAIGGKLSVRADETKHSGDYKEIIKGINKTLDAVIEPIQEASQVLQEMARGNLNAQVRGNYQGDHAAIKDSLNFTITSVKSYISEISRVLSRMAQGDLNVEITEEFKGDFAELKKSINNIIGALNEVLGEINVAAEQVSGGSKQVAMSSQALSQGATEQASAVEEITSTVHEIAEQTKINAGNANKAKELSTGSSKDAVVGNEQMKEMVKAMKEINESSANISKIISVIDEIAFQTNILALNAAVEAARAGQYGKGFAVVAEEVRNLAARSANAAKETTVLIENSISKVNHGTEIATDTANALDKIVGSVSSTADIVENIAKSSQEQATAISQVNEGIYQISQVTQSNTATAEESAAASEEMTSQAQLLKEMVDRFKLKQQSRGLYNQNNYGGGSFHSKPRMVIASADEMDYEGEISISLDDKEFGKY